MGGLGAGNHFVRSPRVGQTPARSSGGARGGPYQVSQVIDGDTLLLANGATVRLIAVDTPETVKPNHPVEQWGPEASGFTKLAVDGQTVRLEFDRERVDRFGRFLAYVWFRDAASPAMPEKLLNEELVRAGLARAALQYNNSAAMERRLKQAEEAAQRAGVGIWSTPASRRAA